MPDVFATKRVEKTVEIVCQRGCEYARQVIVQLEAGETEKIAELRDPADSEQVLVELKEIMSVYDDSGGSCCPVPDFEKAISTAGIKKASR